MDVNRNLLYALIAYRGLKLSSLGQLCDPPVTAASLSIFFAGKGGAPRLGTQVAEILRPSLEDLANEIMSSYDGGLRCALFNNKNEAPYGLVNRQVTGKGGAG